MTVPNYQAFMLPLLRFTADNREHTWPEAIEALAREFGLSEADVSELIPSGRKTKLYDRVTWAGTYLRKAGLLGSPARGRFQITARGKDVLKRPPEQINVEFLGQYQEFVDFQTRRDKPDEEAIVDEVEAQTPEEAIEVAYQSLRQSLTDEILITVKACSAGFFERLVVDVLVKMGYGGTRKDAGKAIGRSGDDGIDGIINEDRLGLDVIYLQAKKWESPVGRPEIQKFAGALQGQRAKKGVFITTSTFTKEAQDFAARIDSKITLIDGQTLSQLMLDYNVGVNAVASYELKRLDSDYFIEE